MAWIKINRKQINKAIWKALFEVANVAVEKIVENTPRDLDRLPKNNINRKDGKTPQRSGRFKAVRIWWNFYEWVSWNLKRSIGFEVKNPLFVKVWSTFPIDSYAWYQEFWTVNMPARSYLRKTFDEEQALFQKVFIKTFNRSIN